MYLSWYYIYDKIFISVYENKFWCQKTIILIKEGI